ncbi:MAG: heme exporter protein CcmD [Burkholderiales bacterium]|nr:heme exporter protein CcmD [Burkholderiales bacterium]GIK88180.1 MAG: hypothetical protein BroJett026_36610 [Betaproteobacteria bacterium]
MNHWHFILGAYGVTVLAMVVEILAARARRRAALEAARAGADAPVPGAQLSGTGGPG